MRLHIVSMVALCLVSLTVPWLVGGCPRPEPNEPPVANAGADQTVEVGAAVTLNGGGSSDPDGDTLTFAWTQTAGTTVTLSGANTAGPTFTAPDTAGTLTFTLSVSDGAETASDSVDVIVNETGNQPPVANAGPNQSVNFGVTVTLNGTGSGDPDGDPITYSWTQTAGTTVTLSGADTASPTFTSPDTAGTLTFELSVSDGMDTASDSVEVGVEVPVTQTPILFIANFGGNGVLGYDISDVNNVNGNIPPSANLSGAQTLLAAPADIVIGGDGSLLVANFAGNRVTTYLNAQELAGINGNVAPARNVQGAATTLNGPASLAILPTSDVMLVSNLNANNILTFASVTTSGFNGNMPPIRTFTSTDLTDGFGINFGAGDTLYVANFNGKKVTVFDNASTLNGAVAATRVITSAAFGRLYDVFVETASDRMFVVDDLNNQIHVLNNASTKNGDVSPDVTLTIPGGGELSAIAVDSKGIGYVVDVTNNAVYSYDNIATRNGTLPPDRTLKGANTQLNSPIRVFLSE